MRAYFYSVSSYPFLFAPSKPNLWPWIFFLFSLLQLQFAISNHPPPHSYHFQAFTENLYQSTLPLPRTSYYSDMPPYHHYKSRVPHRHSDRSERNLLPSTQLRPTTCLYSLEDHHWGLRWDMLSFRHADGHGSPDLSYLPEGLWHILHNNDGLLNGEGGRKERSLKGATMVASKGMDFRDIEQGMVEQFVQWTVFRLAW